MCIPLRHKKALEHTRWRISLSILRFTKIYVEFLSADPEDLNPMENQRQDFTFASMLFFFYFFSDISLQNTTSSFYNWKSIPAPHWQTKTKTTKKTYSHNIESFPILWFMLLAHIYSTLGFGSQWEVNHLEFKEIFSLALEMKTHSF